MTRAFISADHESLDEVLLSIGDAVCVADEHMVFIAANANFAAFYGQTDPSVLIGKSAFEFYPDFKKSVFYEVCERTIASGQTATRFGFSSNLKNWVVIRCYKQREHRYVMVVHRLSEGSAKADYSAHVDPLTSLPNRWVYEQDAQALRGYGQAQFGLTLIDINHFKHINDTLGHAVGDLCLMEVAARIKQVVSANDRVYRLGNDQFLVLGAGSPFEMTQRHVALKAALDEPLLVGGEKSIVLQFYHGVHVSEYPETGSEALGKAERAVYWAKQHKTERVEFSPHMAESSYDPTLTKAIKDAMEQGQLVAYFQPQMDLLDGATCGAELLVRWQHPTRGMVPPGEFLPFAEETGLIKDIDVYMTGLAFDHLERLKAKGVVLSLSLNLSAQSICDKHTVTLFEEHLARTGLSADQLCLEITETSMMHDVATSQWVIEQLKGLGFEIALDDFGTGYSSMSYLTRYPSHFLKIDRSFIRAMSDDAATRTMVRNMINLAHGLSIGVVAEGVEREEELKILRKYECDIVQGYHFAKPMSADAFDAWVTTHPISTMESPIR